MTTRLTTFTLTELLAQLNSREITSVEVTQAFLDAIDRQDQTIHAFLHVDREAVLQQAQAVDQKRASGAPMGLLAGLPVAVKDVLCTLGQPTTCGSRILKNFVAPYDAGVISKLRNADAVLLGKTNMDEFAMGSSGENSALGSDTGGSIRQPAALCGIVGLKPTYGRVSRYGVVAYASSLDQIGPIGTDVESVATLLEAISGHDPRDSTSVRQEVPAFSRMFDQPLAGLRIGVPVEHFAEGLDDEVEKAVRDALAVYRSLGAELKEIHLPHSKYAVATYYLVATSEASSNLSRYDGVHYGHRAEKFGNSLVDMYEASRGEGFGAEVKRRIMLGVFSLSAGYADKYYSKALQVRRLIRSDFDKAFEQVDVIAGPTTPTPAFKFGEKTSDPLAMYLSDIYTISANLAGLPAMSIPCGFSSTKLPIGLQLQAPPFEEERLLRAARMFERETDWHHQSPPAFDR